MKVAFVIIQRSFYRVLGPVIDRALEDGCRVECWHDYSAPTTGLRKFLFPAMDAVPRFRHGQPVVHSYLGPAELVQRLERGEVDAVVSIAPLDYCAGGTVPISRPLWACLQSGHATFKLSSQSLKSCDFLALCSPWWLDWGVAQYGAAEGTSDVSALRAELEARARYVGFPAAEAARLVDREAVRRRCGIQAGQPVVVLLPFPSGVGRNNFWPRSIFSDPSRSRRVFNVLKHRQFKHMGAAWRHVNDADVVRAVRNFCDRNGAFLLVKSRERTPIPDYVRAVADTCLYDESYYPSTIVEALSIADLCIHYYSLGALEAASLGVPSLCIAGRAEDLLGDHAGHAESTVFESFFNRRAGGIFEFNSVSRTLDPAEAIAALPSRTLEDFRMGAADRQQYWQTFLGNDDGLAAKRTLDAVESAAASTDVRRRR